MTKQPLLGLCPIGKFVFSHEDAMKQKRSIEETLDTWNISYVNIDSVIPDGMVRDQKHVEPVVEYLKQQFIDALFVPHCNFGTEGAVGMIAKKLSVPVLLWGPRDEAPLADGSRYRDSLCGMFASSKVLVKLDVPFTYIENCRVDEAPFREGITRFLKAASVVKALRTMRIGQVGVRVDFFWTTIDNENELLQTFGVEVVPFDMADVLRSVKDRAQKNRDAYRSELKTYEPMFADPSVLATDGTIANLALRDELFDLAEREDLDGFAVKTFTSIQTELGVGVPLGMMLAQDRFPVASESDLHGTIGSILINAASPTEEPSFFPEFTVRHPQNDNAILLWHGTSPWSLRHPDSGALECHPPWILKDLPGASPIVRLKDGPLTVCRFDGERSEYLLGIGEGRTIDGPATREMYAWMEVDDWRTWERRIMEGPYIHHCSAVYGHCADALEEACKYIPGLTAERFDGAS